VFCSRQVGFQPSLYVPRIPGLYVSYPESHDFGVGRIEKDQVEDYARRKGWDAKTAERCWDRF
jgi:hypothetical protein